MVPEYNEVPQDNSKYVKRNSKLSDSLKSLSHQSNANDNITVQQDRAFPAPAFQAPINLPQSPQLPVFALSHNDEPRRTPQTFFEGPAPPICLSDSHAPELVFPATSTEHLDTQPASIVPHCEYLQDECVNVQQQSPNITPIWQECVRKPLCAEKYRKVILRNEKPEDPESPKLARGV